MINEMSLGLGPVRSDFIFAVWPRTCYLASLSPSAWDSSFIIGTMMRKHLLLLLFKLDTKSESTIAWCKWILLLLTTEREYCCRQCGLWLKTSSVLRLLLPLSWGISRLTIDLVLRIGLTDPRRM